MEIQNEPMNNINKLKENLMQKDNNKNGINEQINFTGKDINLIVTTNDSAQLLYLKNLSKIEDIKDGNISILSHKNDKSDINKPKIEGANILKGKGNFKFKFEINPLNSLGKPIKITVGFEIDYIDDTDINIISEENNQIHDENIRVGCLYETLSVMRHLLIYKKTNIIHVMINIFEGKFFVVGKNELDKRNNRKLLKRSPSAILYLRNFPKIKLNQIRDVRPIFKYNKNDLQFVDINISGNKLNNNQLNNI